MNDTPDIVIIGSGVGGSTVAKILILEARLASLARFARVLGRDIGAE